MLTWSIVIGVVVFIVIDAENHGSFWQAVAADAFNIFSVVANAAAFLIGAGALVSGIAARSTPTVARQIAKRVVWIAIVYGAPSSVVVVGVVWMSTTAPLQTGLSAAAVGAMFVLWVLLVRAGRRAFDNAVARET